VKEVLGAVVKEKALRRQLDVIRARGHEICESAGIAGVTDVRFPVFGPAGQAIAAVTTPSIVPAYAPPSRGHRTVQRGFGDVAQRIKIELDAGAVLHLKLRRPHETRAANVR
jgi:DNA-binding IclR family transcriptional regulator